MTVAPELVAAYRLGRSVGRRQVRDPAADWIRICQALDALRVPIRVRNELLDQAITEVWLDLETGAAADLDRRGLPRLVMARLRSALLARLSR